MTGSGMLKFGDVVWVEIPVKGPHPAMIVYDLGGGGYILANGTGTPEKDEPIVKLSLAAAYQCGLKKETCFYPGMKFIWLWRPPSGGNVQVIGSMLSTYSADIRKSVTEAMKSTGKNLAAEIQKLQAEAGFTFDQLGKLREVLRVGLTAEGDHPGNSN